MNSFSCIGNVGATPEFSYLDSGTAMCKFRIACRKVRGKKDDDADWFNAIAFGKLAEIMAEHVDTGQKLGLAGHINTRSWKDDDGWHNMFTINIDNFEFLPSGQGSDDDDQESQGSSSATQSEDEDNDEFYEDEEDDNGDPFGGK